MQGQFTPLSSSHREHGVGPYLSENSTQTKGEFCKSDRSTQTKQQGFGQFDLCSTRSRQDYAQNECFPWTKRNLRPAERSTQTKAFRLLDRSTQTKHYSLKDSSTQTNHYQYQQTSPDPRTKQDRWQYGQSPSTVQNVEQTDQCTQTETSGNATDVSTQTKQFAVASGTHGQSVSLSKRQSLTYASTVFIPTQSKENGYKRHTLNQKTQNTNVSQTQTKSPTDRKTPRQTKNPIRRGPVEMATAFWRESVREWYSNLLGQTYFLPPLHFNRVQYDIQNVAGQTVLVPKPPGDEPVNPVPCDTSPQYSSLLPLASQVWPDHPVPPGDPMPRVQDSDVTDDRAMQLILQNIKELAERKKEVMMVLSQLEFRKYLDNKVDPITEAASSLLPRPAQLGLSRGNFDLLIISRRYGMIVGEMKSVGADPQYSTDQIVVRRVEKAMKQLNKADVVLRQLVSDLAPINVTKTLMLPNITSEQLQRVLNTNPRVRPEICQCLGATDTAAAVARCLCADSLQDSVWWKWAVTDHGDDTNMTDDIYETLVARFCGPATTVEVPTVTTPRRVMELRTRTEAIAHTGLRMAVLTLHPEQVELLNRPGLKLVFLWGPPGTGKTVVLTLKGLQWRHQGKDVHLLSSHKDSRAAIMLIEKQLLHALAAAPHVHCHMYDFENNREHMEIAVNELVAAASNGQLYVIADEAFCGRNTGQAELLNTGDRFAEFVTSLADRVPDLHLWAASIRHDETPECMSVERLTTPVRCPPVVVKKVQESVYVNNKDVPRYSKSTIPAPTDGPEIKTIQHSKEHGNTGRLPENCEQCADAIVDEIVKHRVGQQGQDLQYRDTMILCGFPEDNLVVVSKLRERGLPVKVFRKTDGDVEIRNVALAESNAVAVSNWKTVSGLERRFLVMMDYGGLDPFDKLYASSRCTSFLVNVEI